MARITILGAGAGGLASAADLSLKGHEVRLFSRSSERIRSVIERRGVELSAAPGSGLESGLAEVAKATTDVKEAMLDTDIVLVQTVATAHRDMVRAVAPHLRSGQTVVFSPGFGGSLESSKMLRDMRIEESVDIAETQILFYGCRVTEPGKVRVSISMRKNRIAALPAKKTDRVVGKIGRLYSVVAAKNVLETTLINPNPVIHPIPSVLNVGSAVSKAKGYSSYGEGMSPSVLKCVDALDNERRRICKAAGVDSRPLDDYYYELVGSPVYRPDRSATKEIQSPMYTELPRFIEEDVPYGLVPWAQVADSLGVDTPLMDGTIEFASTIKDVDYWDKGLTLEKLGIAGMTRPQLDSYLLEGA